MSLSHISINAMSAEECATVRELFDRIGDRWSLYIVGQLRHGPCRFNQLKRDIEGISQRMLTLTLRGLERDGLIDRTVFPTNPPQVEYALTELGETFLQPIAALIDWAEKSRDATLASRLDFDQSHAQS